MPVYEYQCTQCQEHVEVIQKFSDEPLTTCTSCGGTLKKIIAATAFVLKGSGWYVTDYPSAERKKAMEDKTSKSADKDVAGQSSKEEKKSAVSA